MFHARVHGRPLTALLAPIPFLVLAATAHADGRDLTAPGASATINGAVFEALSPNTPSSRGRFDAFLRIGSNQPLTGGYNTDHRPAQFDEDRTKSSNHSLLLSAIPVQTVGGVDYREVQLDINQRANGSGVDAAYYLTLDQVQLFESPYAELCGYPFDGSGGGQPGCSSNTATLIYDIDAGENSFAVMNYWNGGSGRRDLRVLIPASLFSQDPNCAPGGVGCTVYVTLYSSFGADFDGASPVPILQIPHGNNGGPEEWGVR